MGASVIIPARYDSTRFPGKPLALLKGKPLIQHVYENSSGSRLASGVVVATDSDAVYEAVLSFGGKAVMTSKAHASGTDRCAEAALKLDCDIIVNVQGDEPLIRPEMIDDVIGLLDDKRASIGTLARKADRKDEVFDPNIVKVVFDGEGFAFYFSRAPIPYHRDGWEGLAAYKHVGIYSYRKDALLRLSMMRPSALERIERLEQLRALESGMKIKVKETYFETIGVDTPDDMERVEKWLSSSS
jgi:3-deoxy-manno-octulosonate cytidylyltransferase (CMP-KDO synthetase)